MIQPSLKLIRVPTNDVSLTKAVHIALENRSTLSCRLLPSQATQTEKLMRHLKE